VIQAPASFRLEPGMTCRVDVATGELVTRTDPHYSRRGFIERVRAEKEKKAGEGAPQRQASPTESSATAQDKGTSTGRSREAAEGRQRDARGKDEGLDCARSSTSSKRCKLVAGRPAEPIDFTL
jgi:hypothetical protein